MITQARLRRPLAQQRSHPRPRRRAGPPPCWHPPAASAAAPPPASPAPAPENARLRVGPEQREGGPGAAALRMVVMCAHAPAPAPPPHPVMHQRGAVVQRAQRQALVRGCLGVAPELAVRGAAVPRRDDHPLAVARKRALRKRAAEEAAGRLGPPRGRKEVPARSCLPVGTA